MSLSVRALPTVDRDLPTEVWHNDGIDTLDGRQRDRIRVICNVFWVIMMCFSCVVCCYGLF